MDVFREFGTGKGLSDPIVADIGNLAQTIQQAESMQDTCIDADADIGVTGFDPLKGGTGREGSFGHDSHG